MGYARMSVNNLENIWSPTRLGLTFIVLFNKVKEMATLGGNFNCRITAFLDVRQTGRLIHVYQTARRHNPEDRSLNTHRRERPISHM
jgi:hypothetical protein